MGQYECVVVIPAYNESDCIAQVLTDWLAVIASIEAACILVIDDGSTDNTNFILADLCRLHPQLKVFRQRNRGHGAAVLAGFLEALKLRPAWVFQADGDGQINAADMLKLWARREHGTVLLGWRSGRQDPRLRCILSAIHRFILGVLFSVHLRDPNVPFRLMRSATLEGLLTWLPNDMFAPNAAIAIAAVRAGERIVEIEVRQHRRRTGRSSIRGWNIAGVAVRCMADLVRLAAALGKRGKQYRANPQRRQI